MLFSTFVCAARRAGDALAEMNYASARLMAMRLSQGVEQSDRAPDTYAEFLLRAPFAMPHEPPARCR